MLVLALIGGAIGWVVWLAMPNGGTTRRMGATVLSIAPGVQSSHDAKPVQAVITLRLDDGATLTTRRSVKCMDAIRPGNRVDVRGIPNNAGAISWEIERLC